MNSLKEFVSVALCLLGLSATALAQEKVAVPTGYKEAKAELKTGGPVLLFSDSPEMVYNNGILYRDVVQGHVRLFFHHVNGVSEDRRLAVVVKNPSQLRSVAYNITRSGIADGTYNYMAGGKNALKSYFGQKQKLGGGVLYGDTSKELLGDGRGVILSENMLLTGIIDMEFSREAQVSVLMLHPKADIELADSDGKILPMDEHPLRGTFKSGDWYYTLKKPVKASDTYMLYLAGSENYAKGIDKTTGLAAENYGNYGVVYHVRFKVKGDKPVSFMLNPIGGYFAGYGVLRNVTTGQEMLLALPEETESLGETIEDAVELAQLQAGEYDFVWTPPGASNLPVRLFWTAAKISVDKSSYK